MNIYEEKDNEIYGFYFLYTYNNFSCYGILYEKWYFDDNGSWRIVIDRDDQEQYQPNVDLSLVTNEEKKIEQSKKDDKKLAMEDQDILEECAKVEKELEGNGRILLRASGTENLIRVMVEASSDELTDKYCEQVAQIVREKYEVK